LNVVAAVQGKVEVRGLGEGELKKYTRIKFKSKKGKEGEVKQG
jgi:hypothetical protein